MTHDTDAAARRARGRPAAAVGPFVASRPLDARLPQRRGWSGAPRSAPGSAHAATANPGDA